MPPVTDETIIRTRLLIDTRPLKKHIKNTIALCHAQLQNNNDVHVEKVAELEVSSLASLNGVEVSLRKHQLIHDMNLREVENYRKEKQLTESKISKGRARIEVLKARLVEAQQTRANKLSYDALAAKITALPSRPKSHATISLLRRKIGTLKHQTAEHNGALARRTQHLKALVTTLEGLMNMIEDEKKQEEDRGFDDDDDAAKVATPAEDEEEEGWYPMADTSSEQAYLLDSQNIWTIKSQILEAGTGADCQMLLSVASST
ncbi:Tho complex subunit 7-domain-containing protein [Gaertneriomyces semiglobifer]|nr:Tho complex subunit 7-domain-containing protein [Gaertneriomyces semiglobifer]